MRYRAIGNLCDVPSLVTELQPSQLHVSVPGTVVHGLVQRLEPVLISAAGGDGAQLT